MPAEGVEDSLSAMLDPGQGPTSKAVAVDALKRPRTSLADVEAVEQALRGQVVLYESVLASLAAVHADSR